MTLTVKREIFRRLSELSPAHEFWRNRWMFTLPVFMQESRQLRDPPAFWQWVASTPAELQRHIDRVPGAGGKQATTLTPSDREAMRHMPQGWFYPLDLPYPTVRRAEYRCDRLHAAGALERQVVTTKLLEYRTLYRLVTPASHNPE